MSAYGPLCTEFYDLDKPHPPEDAISYYLARARDCGNPVLEPMCGSGRFLIPLLAAGIDVHGVDNAPSMLAACRKRALALGLKLPVLYEQALEKLSLPHSYRMALVPAGSIGLIDSDEKLAIVLRALRNHLQPGALLLLELLTPRPENTQARALQPRILQVDPETTLSYHCHEHVISAGHIVRYDGVYERRHGGNVVAHEEETLFLRIRTPAELTKLLLMSGFVKASVIRNPEYGWLHDNHALLIEAMADA